MSDLVEKLTRMLNREVPAKAPEELSPSQVHWLRTLEGKGFGKYLPDSAEMQAAERQRAADEHRAAIKDLADFNRDVRTGKYQADREAQEEAERQQGLSAQEALIEAFRGGKRETSSQSWNSSGAGVPLNGAGILAAAVRGLGGGATVNGSR
ncbi:hypothetical protein ACXPWS_09165 [Mycobacterium sp. BMJ-28]